MTFPSRTLTVSAAALAAFVLGPGCARIAGLQTLAVSELAARLAGSDAPLVLDANLDKTRQRLGTIPGARLLSSYHDYDPATELPGEKSRALVFYCYNSWCSAASEAAQRALDAGYTRVAVMEAGIEGWIEAGYPVERLP